MTTTRKLSELLVEGEQETVVQRRLEYLRGELRAECISYGELAELQSLARHISADDVELREAAGLPEQAPTLAHELAGARAQMLEWRILAQEMTPGGSEFMEPESVRAYYRRFKDDAHQAKKDRANLRAQIKLLREACEHVVKYDGRKIGSIGEAMLRTALAQTATEAK